MAGTKVDEVIVERHEEIGGSKIVNGDKDAHPTKRAKVEGDEAADCSNLGDKAEGEAADDKAEGEAADDKAEGEAAGDREEEENQKKVDRLRRLMEDDPKKLRNKDVEDVIRYMDVDEIISLGLKSEQGNGSDHDGEVEKWMEDEGECEKVLAVAVRRMLCYIEGVMRSELRLLYEKLSPKAFAMLLLAALGSYSIRRVAGGTPLVKEEERATISTLCCVLPWKLFAHILSQKSWVPVLDDETDVEEEEEECTLVQIEAARSCNICIGKGRHTGSSGSYCTFMDAIPKGNTVGAGYRIACSYCGLLEPTNSFDECLDCGCEVGRAVPIPRSLTSQNF